MSVHQLYLVNSPLLVLMEDQWKALNEKGVAAAYVGTSSIVSPEIVCTSNFYMVYFSPRRQGMTRAILV